MRTRLGLLLAPLAALSAPLHAAVDIQGEAKKIDAILQADWEKHDLSRNPDSDDSTFLRRIYLDIIGRIPTTRETRDFLGSNAKDKRSQLIQKLLKSDAHSQHAYNYWADVLRLQTRGQQAGVITGAAYSAFIKKCLSENVPYDQMVRDLVAAEGKAWDNGAIGYYMRDRGMPLDNMANTVRVFLGTRIECAQCHNHPFDKWTQMQFYQMAAFTYGVVAGDYSDGTSAEARNLMREEELALRASFPEPKRPRKEKGMSDADYKALAAAYDKERKKNQDAYNAARSEMRQEQRNYNNVFTDIRNTMRYTSVTVRDRDLRLPHDYQYDDAAPKSSVAPAAMMGHAVEVNPTETPLQAYARWMTDANNPRFTSVIVNRLWKRAFGLALIEPLDELMEGTVPMIPELQTHLEDLMKRVGYDMRAFQQILFNTRTYQAQATRDEISPGTQYHFTGPLLRRMGAEQMWDSFVTLINPNPDMPNQAERERAASVILAAKKTADAVDSLSAEEYLNGVRTAARVYDANREQTEALQKVYLTARTTNKDIEQKYRLADADGKKALQAELDASREEIKDLRGKINVVQRAGRQMTQQAVLLPGIRKLYEKVTGKPAPTDGNPSKATSASSSGEPSMTADSSMMMADAGSKTKEIAIPGYDRRAISPEAKKAAAEEEEVAFREEAAFFGVTDKEFKTYSRARKDQMRNFLRAAEIDSPAPRGHYLREFGQSDRETIENANNEASVPQALAMMNGQLLPQILSPYSQLMLTLRKAQYPDDQLEAAYLAILSRPPTDVERQTWLTAQSRGLDSTEDLIFALLNTQQFIFIQ